MHVGVLYLIDSYPEPSLSFGTCLGRLNLSSLAFLPQPGDD